MVTALNTFGFIITLIACLKQAPWKEVLILFFSMDSLVPVIIAGIIGYVSLQRFVMQEQPKWYHYAYMVNFPLWVVYFGGFLKVMIAYAEWSRWEVIFYKISVMACGLTFFYVGFSYMNGGYKITSGFIVQIEWKFRDLVYLFVFGVEELYFEFYRRLSYFDQTEELKYEYTFKSSAD